MRGNEGSATSSTLLNRVRDERDHPAWNEFFSRYDPLLREWCGDYRLDDESVDELCQNAWRRLWPRMRNFQYDPSLRFRGWLRRFLHCCAMDLLKERSVATSLTFDPVEFAGSDLFATDRHDLSIDDDEEPFSRLVLIHEGREAQKYVNAQVKPATWQAFWMTKIEGRPTAEVATLLGKSYAAVYYGSERVCGMLRAEGERRLGMLAIPLRRTAESD